MTDPGQLRFEVFCLNVGGTYWPEQFYRQALVVKYELSVKRWFYLLKKADLLRGGDKGVLQQVLLYIKEGYPRQVDTVFNFVDQ
jgi:hypothetical protein